jgi:TolB-like protein/Flp pilus assembly protein TadD
MPDDSLFSELRKRKVVQAAAIYGAVAWGVTEVVVTVTDQLFLPRWVSTVAVLGFVVGFPLAMFLAWTFDLTSEGIQRTAVTSRRGRASIAFSLVLLVAGTAGLFFLISPSLPKAETSERVYEAPANSVAVLPFENAGKDPDDVYLGESLSDEVRDQLGRVRGLRIAARSSSVSARALGDNIRSRAMKLGVARLVEGSLRRQGQRLRISVQLIDGFSGLVIWTDTFERGPNELLALQQEIVDNVIQLMLPDAGRVEAEPATRDASANELMLLARYYEEQVRSRVVVDTDTLLNAVQLYRDAVELDPESALAHSRLAGALLFLGDLEAAEAPIFRALSLNSELSEVQQTLGLYYFARGMPEANTAFRRAVELNPNNADALANYAFGLWVQGIEENVVELYRRALELDPLSLSRYGALGGMLGQQGRSEEVLDVIGRIEAVFDDVSSYRVISRLLEMIGRIDEAIAWAIRARDLEPDNEDHVLWLAELYTIIGDSETARNLAPDPSIGLLYVMRRYEELIEVAEYAVIERPEDVDVRYLLAFALTAVGDYESAIWVLSSTGLPETVMTLPRSPMDWNGYMTLMNATFAQGEQNVAEGLADWYFNYPTHPRNPDWTVDTWWACSLLILGREDEALENLERIRTSPRLALEAVIEDMPCLRQLAEKPEFQAVKERLGERRKELRDQLPSTLAEFGVTL